MKTVVAVVGAGHWGPHLVRNFSAMTSCDVRWLIDTNPSRLEQMAPRYPFLKTDPNIEKALNDPEVDAVAIATPSATHFEIARDALAAGKHVLVEKPIATSSAEAVLLCREAERRNLQLMVGHIFLFNNAIRSAQGYIASGSLGQTRYISMTRTNLGPVRGDVNAAWDLASHDLSIVDYWLEEDPVSVSATAGSWLQSGVEDIVVASLRYPSGVLVHFEASWLNPRKHRLISVVGSERMLTVDDMDLIEPLRLYNKGVDRSEAEPITDTFAGFRAEIREGEVIVPHVSAGEPLLAECESFVRRIQGSDETLSDGWVGARVVAALEAIDQSIRDGGAEAAVRPPG